MINYKKILVAVDLTAEAKEVLAAARQIADQHSGELSVLCVILPLTYAYTGFEASGVAQAMLNFEPRAFESTQQALTELCAPLGVPPERIHVQFGRPADEIKSLAESMEADLVVVGSHGRRGLGLLLGSTANGVLHGAPCDVLTIRIHE